MLGREGKWILLHVFLPCDCSKLATVLRVRMLGGEPTDVSSMYGIGM